MTRAAEQEIPEEGWLAVSLAELHQIEFNYKIDTTLFSFQNVNK